MLNKSAEGPKRIADSMHRRIGRAAHALRFARTQAHIKLAALVNPGDRVPLPNTEYFVSSSAKFVPRLNGSSSFGFLRLAVLKTTMRTCCTIKVVATI